LGELRGWKLTATADILENKTFQLENSPTFSSHMRQMSQMQQITNSLFPSDPFGFGMLGGMMMPHMGAMRSRMNLVPHRGSPFDIGMNMNMGMGMNRLLAAPASSSFSSSSSVFISNGNGPAQVYKETSSVRSVNGVRETRKTVEDSTTGRRQLAIGHHAGDRARIVEKEQNIRTGEREEREELINLDDDETEEFEREFQSRAAQNHHRNHRHQLQIEEIGSEPLPAIQS
jgi:myeloid leukemia factor 1